MDDSNLMPENESEERALQRILSLQCKRYPLLEVQDLYKLIHQASMGSEHAIQDVSDARLFLEREANALIDGPEEPVRDVISPDHRILRINLRPYITSGASLSKLFDAFVHSANEFSPGISRFERYWSYTERLGGEIPFAFSKAAIRTFFKQMKDEGFPAVHHSAVYASAYQPAYRVVLAELFSDP